MLLGVWRYTGEFEPAENANGGKAAHGGGARTRNENRAHGAKLKRMPKQFLLETVRVKEVCVDKMVLKIKTGRCGDVAVGSGRGDGGGAVVVGRS